MNNNNIVVNRRGVSDPNKVFQRKISMNNNENNRTNNNGNNRINNNIGRFDIIN